MKRQNIQPEALAARVVGGHVLYSHVVAVEGGCACGSSGGAACGAGGVMAWERGRGEGARGRGGR